MCFVWNIVELASYGIKDIPYAEKYTAVCRKITLFSYVES